HSGTLHRLHFGHSRPPPSAPIYLYAPSIYYFFFHDTPTTEIYTLSLHDALPIWSRKARVSYKVQRTINASLNAATSTRAVSSNPNFVTRQKIEIIFG